MTIDIIRKLGILGFVAATLVASVEASDAELSAHKLKLMSPEAQRAIATADSLSLAFRSVSDHLLPSIVSIETTAQESWSRKDPNDATKQPAAENPFKGTPYEDMFRGRKFQSPQGTPRGGIGSGVIIDAAGVILTNNHVIAGGGKVVVRLHDGREFEAIDVRTDPKTDIAVVKIDATNLVAASMGDSDNVQIGDWVLALGQPFGLEKSVTAGIISAKHRGIGLNARENYLQTDAAINPGNSGGPLVNLHGEIVGINTAISSRSGGNDGIGFAVPINLAKWISSQLLDIGRVQRAYLGVGIQPVTHDLAEQLGVNPREGVVVTNVFPKTPASKSGLESGDVIIRLADKAVDSPQNLQLIVERSESGKPLDMEIVRAGKSLTLNFVPEEQPAQFGGLEKSTLIESPHSSRLDKLGLEVEELEEDLAKSLGVETTEGVVITAVRADSPAEDAGLMPGMVIKRINQTQVNSAQQMQEAVDAEADGNLLLLVKTQNGSRFVVLKF